MCVILNVSICLCICACIHAATSLSSAATPAFLGFAPLLPVYFNHADNLYIYTHIYTHMCMHMYFYIHTYIYIDEIHACMQ